MSAMTSMTAGSDSRFIFDQTALCLSQSDGPSSNARAIQELELKKSWPTFEDLHGKANTVAKAVGFYLGIGRPNNKNVAGQYTS